ncbi:MAG: glycosyltransferase family 4 protein [Phycisphaerae bacterium]
MVGGLEWKVHHLACAYMAMGHQVTVLTALKPDSSMPKVCCEQPYQVIRFGLPFRGTDRLLINRYLGLRALRRAHRGSALDIVHAHHVIIPAHSAIQFQKSAGVPVVLTPTGGDVQCVREIGYGVRLDPFWERVLRRNVQNAAAVTAINHHMVEVLAELGARSRPRYIPNGVRWNDFQVARTDLLARRLGLPAGAFVFLSVGRLVEVKNQAGLLTAFAQVARRCREAVLVLVGRDVPSLGPQAREGGLEKRVFLIDQLPITELPAVFRSADAYVSAALMEGFPQVVAQALASGLPCVLSDNPGHRAVAGVGGAIVVNGTGPDELAEGMIRLVEDRALAGELAAAGHEGSRAYDWDEIARQYLQLFEEVREGDA